jgi:PAS domain S-box-containing protein
VKVSQTAKFTPVKTIATTQLKDMTPATAQHPTPSMLAIHARRLGSFSEAGGAIRVARVAGGCVVAVGLLALAGWMFDVPFLKGPLHGLGQMKTNSAIGFIATGVALLLTISQPSAGRQRATRLLAGLAIAIGTLTLAEFLLGRNLGLDQLLFRDARTAHALAPGRMAPQAAINFISLGSALLLLNTADRPESRLVGAFIGTSFVIALFALIGYAFGVSDLNGIPGFGPIAFTTAITFLMLCVGTAAGCPDCVCVDLLSSKGPGGVVLRRLLPSVVVFPIFGWLLLEGQRQRLYSAAVAVTLFVIVSTVVLALAIASLAKRLNHVEAKRQRAAVRGVRLATLIDASNEAIMSADADGLIVTWNRAAEALYGYTEAEITGQPLSVISPPEKVLEQRQLLQAAARGDVNVELDTQRVHKNGSLLDVSVTVSRIMQDGLLSGFCTVNHDIRDRVRARVELERSVRERTHDLFRSRAATLQSLARAAEYRDYETAQHTERVGHNAARLAAQLGLPASLAALIREAAPLHDVGKIGIPDQILLKPAKLTPEEFEIMKQHTILGARLLAGSDGEVLQLGEQIALTHHERWDGNGYPAGLAAEAIPIAARIVAVVDSFDAMTHDRPYRSPSSLGEALAEISRCSASQFDPQVVKAFLQLHHAEAKQHWPKTPPHPQTAHLSAVHDEPGSSCEGSSRTLAASGRDS